MKLVQRFLNTIGVETPVFTVKEALRLRGRELFVVSLLEPELFTGPADWLAVLLEYQHQRVAFQNLMMATYPVPFLQRLVVYVDCMPPQGEIYSRCEARAQMPKMPRQWSAGATTEAMTADGKILSSGNLNHLFDDLDFAVENGANYDSDVVERHIDLRTPLALGW